MKYQHLQHQVEEWRNDSLLDLKDAIIHTLVDGSMLSARFNEGGIIESVGFGYPAQFEWISEDSIGVVDWRLANMLATPQPNGQKLEWVVEECLQHQQLPKQVLCLDDKIPQQIEPSYKIVLVSQWDPVKTHNGFTFQIHPDMYGIGKND